MSVVGSNKKKQVKRIDLDNESSLEDEITPRSSALVDQSGRIKIATPDLFYNDKEKFKQFAMQVDLHIAFNLGKFANGT